MRAQVSFTRVLNPCFLFRPDIFVRACWRKLRERPERCLAKTAWGDWLEIEPRKFIGASIYIRGVHELAVCEVLWRLAGSGETAVDAGANIGVMTSLLSRKVGGRGRVLAFEAHPGLFSRLEQNVRRWKDRRIELFNCALSRQSGVVSLREGTNFSGNEGTARIGNGSAPGRSYEVRAVGLDEILSHTGCDVVKIDVEGHEVEVLLGAADGLAEQRLRDVVFESTWDFPGRAHELLLGYGYRLFEIQKSWRGPKLARLSTRSGQKGQLADYLATVNASRAQELIARPGWRVLNSQPSDLVTRDERDSQSSGSSPRRLRTNRPRGWLDLQASSFRLGLVQRAFWEHRLVDAAGVYARSAMPSGTEVGFQERDFTAS